MAEQINIDCGSLKNIVESLLKAYNLENFEELPSNVQKHLMKIEEYFRKCESTYLEAKEKLDIINLSQRGISSNTGISRTTFNRNEILNKYIANRVKNLKSNVQLIDAYSINNIKTENEKLKNDLNSMVDSYLELGISRNKIKMLEEKIERLEEEKNIWLSERDELTKQINELSKKCREITKNNVKEISFRKD